MHTPWGDLPVCDAHVHFFSHGFFGSLARQMGDLATDVPAILDWDRPDPDPALFAAQWIAELDRNGIERASIIASVPGDESSVAAAIAAYPDRFFGYFFCDPTAPDAAARVRESLARGLKGVCFFPAMHAYSINDPRVAPVIQAIAEHPGTLAFVHCGVLTVGVRKKLGLPCRFDMRFSNPIDIHPIALAHPCVPFVIPHFGAGYFRETLMLAELCPNVYIDTSSSNSWVRYLAPEVSLRDIFRRSLDIVGAGRLLFGTDSSFFPRGWNKAIFESQAEILYSLGCPKDKAELVLGGNLKHLLLPT